MKRFRGMFGACAVVMFLCIGAAFVGSIFITQNTANLVLPTGLPANSTVSAVRSNTPAPSPTALPQVANDGGFVVDITIQTPGAATATASGNDVEVVVSTTSPTPSPDLGGAGSNLGTLSYPLTATYEAQIQGTKIQSYVNGVDATRTAAAERALPTRMAQTATAAAKKK